MTIADVQEADWGYYATIDGKDVELRGGEDPDPDDSRTCQRKNSRA